MSYSHWPMLGSLEHKAWWVSSVCTTAIFCSNILGCWVERKEGEVGGKEGEPIRGHFNNHFAWWCWQRDYEMERWIHIQSKRRFQRVCIAALFRGGRCLKWRHDTKYIIDMIMHMKEKLAYNNILPVFLRDDAILRPIIGLCYWRWLYRVAVRSA